jgi:hypothetical protein
MKQFALFKMTPFDRTILHINNIANTTSKAQLHACVAMWEAGLPSKQTAIFERLEDLANDLGRDYLLDVLSYMGYTKQNRKVG